MTVGPILFMHINFILSSGEYNFRFMALYEIGHALGLGDSDDCDAVMAGAYNFLAIVSCDDLELAKDDIAGIRVPIIKGRRSWIILI